MKLHRHLFHEGNVPNCSKETIMKMNAELIKRCTAAADYLKREGMNLALYDRVSELIHDDIMRRVNKWT